MTHTYGETVADFKSSDRIELSPHLDLWMMGARFGTVEKVGRTKVHVRLDNISNRIKRFAPDSLRLV